MLAVLVRGYGIVVQLCLLDNDMLVLENHKLRVRGTALLIKFAQPSVSNLTELSFVSRTSCVFELI